MPINLRCATQLRCAAQARAHAMLPGPGLTPYGCCPLPAALCPLQSLRCTSATPAHWPPRSSNQVPANNRWMHCMQHVNRTLRCRRVAQIELGCAGRATQQFGQIEWMCQGHSARLELMHQSIPKPADIPKLAVCLPARETAAAADADAALPSVSPAPPRAPVDPPRPQRPARQTPSTKTTRRPRADSPFVAACTHPPPPARPPAPPPSMLQDSSKIGAVRNQQIGILDRHPRISRLQRHQTRRFGPAVGRP